MKENVLKISLSLISPPVYSKLPPVLNSGLPSPSYTFWVKAPGLLFSEGVVLGELQHYWEHQLSLATFPPKKYMDEGDKMTCRGPGW